MYYLYIITVFAVILSLISDREKTLRAFKIAIKKFIKILPQFLVMIIPISIILVLVPNNVISTYLGLKGKFIGMVFAAFFGSISLMTGFVAYPLCGILLKKGASYMVLSAFATALQMVGVITFPVERAYFGTKVAIIRNVISFVIAIIVALATGIFFGELL